MNLPVDVAYDVAYVNQRGRIQCGTREFNSGEVVEVLLDGAWCETRIEYDFDRKRYYSIDDLPLIGQPVRAES